MFEEREGGWAGWSCNAEEFLVYRVFLLLFCCEDVRGKAVGSNESNMEPWGSGRPIKLGEKSKGGSE